MTQEAVRDAVTGAAQLVRGTPDRDAVVSVCIPVYQGGRHLAPTLESVLAQTMPGVELVVLDNASTDTTPAVLAAVDDPRLVVWRNPATVPMLENFDRVVALSSAPLVKRKRTSFSCGEETWRPPPQVLKERTPRRLTRGRPAGRTGMVMVMVAVWEEVSVAITERVVVVEFEWGVPEMMPSGDTEAQPSVVVPREKVTAPVPPVMRPEIGAE